MLISEQKTTTPGASPISLHDEMITCPRARVRRQQVVHFATFACLSHNHFLTTHKTVEWSNLAHAQSKLMRTVLLTNRLQCN